LLSNQIAFAQIQITDSHGKYTFDQPPERVVVLNWALAEQMLELGVSPVGMADIAGFQKHAHSPSIPTETIDVGKRLNPTLSKIKKLNPDVIVIGYSQRSLLRPLSNIATVIYFKNFGARYNNFEKSRERFTELAKLFNKTELANQKLVYLDSKLAELKSSLIDKFARENRTLPLVQLNVPKTNSAIKGDPKTWLFSNNSMPYYAAQAIGLEVLSSDEVDQYGVSKLNDNELAELIAMYTKSPIDVDTPKSQGPLCELTLSSYASSFEVQPTAKSNCKADLSYQNAFGGTMSVLYLAESIYNALAANTTATAN